VANPFLVLGGIAVGVITATAGILMVPNWIASAQDAAAVADLNNIRIAQETRMWDTGTYADDDTLVTAAGLAVSQPVAAAAGQVLASAVDGVQLSDGVTLAGMVGDGDGWCGVLRSASGKYFAGSNFNGDASGAARVEPAVLGADCIPSQAAAVITEAGGTPPPLPDPDPAPAPSPTPTPDPEPEVTGPTIAFTLNCPAPTSVGLPISGADGRVRWSDESSSTAVSGVTGKHPLTAGQPYKAWFVGTFSTLTADALSPAERACFRSLDKWEAGTGTTSMNRAFYGMTNLTKVPATIPAGITNLAEAFAGATSFNAPIGGWDVSQVTTLASTFAGATSFNQPLTAWNTGKVTTMANTFQGAAAFAQNVSGWNVAKVTSTTGFGTGSNLAVPAYPAFYPNIHTNPEPTSTTGYTVAAATGAALTKTTLSGDNVLRWTTVNGQANSSIYAQAARNSNAATAGVHYKASWWWASAAAPRTATLYLEFRSGTNGDTLLKQYASSTLSQSAEFQQFYVDGVAPAGTQYIYVYAVTYGNSGANNHFMKDIVISRLQ